VALMAYRGESRADCEADEVAPPHFNCLISAGEERLCHGEAATDVGKFAPGNPPITGHLARTLNWLRRSGSSSSSRAYHSKLG